MTVDQPPPPPDSAPRERSGMGRGNVALIGFAVGFLLAVVLLLFLTGNPLSSANEVRYLDVVVGPVSQTSDELCWSTDVEDPVASRTCAILALDPRAAVPDEGDEVTLGVVDIRAPGGQQQTQIVFAAPSDASDGGPQPGATTGAGG
jgi:hypothetical protein